MQSFIIISKTREKAREKAKKITDEQKISKFDVFTLETEKSLGIADVKSITRQIFLTPLRGNKKAVIVECFQGATTEAQNAFLKVLEEPPLSTTIILLSSDNFFLPTILSRCKLIEPDKGMSLKNDEEKEYSQILENLRILKIGEKLKLAQDLTKDRQTALNFMENLIIAARSKMIMGEKSAEYKKKIDILQTYYKEIKQSNVNLRLGLENLFLEI
ncbi:MAG: hypothetical protein COU25_01710 [Candidatus Levybacteria bacterium CG10_big_fil_rev_8_21_14_0_10_35_13]|nr:MAG: hypothetical protein COU25_01710 [Candidatus Levybacteria bacterium CG10_big_fil_rev_8_21_14_0_10_35_13]